MTMSVGGVIAERWYIVRPDDRVSCLYEAYRKAQGINTGRVRIFALKDGRSVELDEDSQSFAVVSD